MQKVMECVVVFIGRKTAKYISSAGGPLCFHRVTKRSGQRVDNDLSLGPEWMLFRLFRRHLADIDEIQHLLPHVGVRAVDHVGIESINPKIRLLLIWTVATDAVFGQKRLNLGLITFARSAALEQKENRRESKKISDSARH